MGRIASGSFEVTLQPLPIELGAAIGRRSIDKAFSGDLVGTSAGQMLSAMGEVTGSAGYVAVERVTGTLHGRRGSFILQHSSQMSRGVPTQSVLVVPDSGTEELVGLEGRMEILIEAGAHRYVFDYSLPG